MTIFTALLRTMRPRQWPKNILFVFPALVFDGQLFNPDSFLRVAAAACLLIVVSGTVYIINDLVDVEKDRLHPKKRFRPIPAGALPVPAAIGAAVALPSIALVAAIALSVPLALVLGLYLIVQLGYSFYFKHVPIVDVLIVTSGFVMRVIAGVVVIGVQNFSPWLYACTGLLALFLVVGKRRQELITLGENAAKTRPIFEHYNLPLLDEMLRFVITSTFMTYLLYTIEVNITPIKDVNLLLFTVPPVLYGLMRYMYLIHIKGEGAAPEEVLLTDRPVQITILVWIVIVVSVIYLPTLL
ncbi:MAG: decaprenyl-phosphate phosphoribosyltransferase [Anaerolineae bacterium]